MNKLLFGYFNKRQSYIVLSKSKSFLHSSRKRRNFVTDSLVGVP